MASEDSFKGLENPGLYLFIAGLLTFFLVEYVNNDFLSIVMATLFMLYSSIFIFKTKSTIITVGFLIWYFVLGGPTDPMVLLINLAWIVVVAMLIHGLLGMLFGKKEDSKGEKFAEGAKGEVIGLIPILFFFLDLGLIEFLIKLGLPAGSITQSLLLFTPWWAYLGLFTAKSSGNKLMDTIVAIAKVLLVLWIVPLLIFGLIPDAYATYQSSLPGPEELLKAKAEVRAQLPKRELLVYSNFRCAISISEAANFKACVERRQKASEMEYKCKEDERVKKGPLTLAECIKELEKAETEGKKIVEGAISDVIKQVTSAELKIDEMYFPKSTANKKAVYPATLELENPRKQELTVAVECTFKKRGTAASADGNVSGNVLIKGEEKNQFTSSKLHDDVPIKCIPSVELQGSYDFLLTAKLSGLTTPSYITRAFLGVMDEEMMKTRTEQIELDKFSNTKSILSQAPKEFARINFAFGVTEKDPVIPVNEVVSFSSSIENTGRGEIVKINNYYFDLQEQGFKIKSGDANCLQGGESSVIKGKSSVLTSCFLELPAEMKTIKDYNVKTFAGYLSYDYMIKKEMLNIKVGESLS